MYKYLILLLAFFLIQSCEDAESSRAVEPSLLQATFEAHGGLEKWKSFKQLSFRLINHREERQDTQHILTDLKSRYERISTKNYVIGYDGHEYWKTMLDTASNNADPTFLINLQFYFFAMPFVLSDPGVKLESLGKRKINEESFDVVKATFGDSVGVAPKDQYLLYLNEENHRLEVLLYSVTYFNPDNAEKYGALVYSDWQDVNGITLPKKVNRRNWIKEQQELAGSRGSRTFEAIQLKVDSPALHHFKRP